MTQWIDQWNDVVANTFEAFLASFLRRATQPVIIAVTLLQTAIVRSETDLAFELFVATCLLFDGSAIFLGRFTVLVDLLLLQSKVVVRGICVLVDSVTMPVKPLILFLLVLLDATDVILSSIQNICVVIDDPPVVLQLGITVASTRFLAILTAFGLRNISRVAVQYISVVIDCVSVLVQTGVILSNLLALLFSLLGIGQRQFGSGHSKTLR